MPLIKILFYFSWLLSGIVMAETGQMDVFVYKDGLPFAKREMVLDGKKKIETNLDGHVFLNLEKGRHFIEINYANKNESIPFYVSSGEKTQIIMNLFSGSSEIDSDVSEPARQKNIESKKVGSIQGQILNIQGSPIVGAKLFIQNLSNPIITNKEGRFKALVPEGRSLISVVHPQYRSRIIRNINILENKTIKRNIKLTPAGLELEEFVVVAPHIKGSISALIEVRRNSSQVAEVMGSEQISKSGDSDAASSLKRVTGLSIVDGKYVYIRGLGERYSTVLLNGTDLPSPDPSRRVVQLDLFPSGILESMVIQKSYSPEYAGSFGGGTVILNTKNIPEEFEGKISIGTGYEANNQISTYQRGSKDWLGIDDGSRAIPQSIKDATSGGRRLFVDENGSQGGYSQAQMQSFSTDMPRIYNTTNEQAALPPSLSFSLGDLYKYKGRKFGFLLSGLYSSSWEQENIERFVYQSDGEDDNESFIDQSVFTARLSGMLNLGIDLGKRFKLSSNTLLLRKSTDRIQNTEISSQNDADNNYRDFTMEWQERELFSQILKGEHSLGRSDIEWRGSFSRAKRYQPDSRNYQQDLRNGIYITSADGKRNQKIYNELVDYAQDYSLKFNQKIIDKKSFKFSTKLGGSYTAKRRQSITQRFKYGQLDADVARTVTGDEDILQKSLEEICTDAVIRAGGCLLEDLTSSSDRYQAKQEIQGYFLDTETHIGSLARLNLGARYEDSTQSITTYDGVDRVELQNGLRMQDILPVAGLTLFLSRGVQLRLNYSETISRPDFKDINPGTYFDDEKNRLIAGNLNLKGTIIKNYDTRMEYYFGKNESISLGAFVKEFVNPIEEIAGSFNSDGELVDAESKFQLANVGNAQSRGYEFEFRKNFSFISPGLEYLSIGGNYSYIDSEVAIFDELASVVTNKNRPLQGQSNHVANANLAYDNPDNGFTIATLYNVFGRRIDTVGTNSFEDIYEESFEQLDVVASKRFFADNKIKIKFQNLINPEVIQTQSGRVRERRRKGRSGSISFTRSF